MESSGELPPKYKFVKEQILNGITDDGLSPGSMIASEHELSRKYNVSKGTIRIALNELVSENYLRREQGKGTFINESIFIRNKRFFRKTRNIGVVLYNSNYICLPWFSNMLHGMTMEAADSNYHVLISPRVNRANITHNRGMEYSELISKNKVDGLIIIDQSLGQGEILKLDNEGIPIVLVDRKLPGSQVPYVAVNNYQGLYDATKYLTGLGHKKILFLLGHEEIQTDKERLDGFKAALADAKIEYTNDMKLEFINESIDLRQPSRKFDAYIKNKKFDSTAIIASSDEIGIYAFNTLAANGYKIPEDVSLINYGGTTLGFLIQPSLTYVEIPLFDIGRIAAEILIRIIEKGSENRPGLAQGIILNPRLVIQDSCRSFNNK